MFGLEEEGMLIPFTLEDAVERNFCISCVYRSNCPIIIYVNKLSLKRDGKGADKEFGCTMFKELDGFEIRQVEDEEEDDK